jgi:hypothetical protein
VAIEKRQPSAHFQDFDKSVFVEYAGVRIANRSLNLEEFDGDI